MSPVLEMRPGVAGPKTLISRVLQLVRGRAPRECAKRHPIDDGISERNKSPCTAEKSLEGAIGRANAIRSLLSRGGEEQKNALQGR